MTYGAKITETLCDHIMTAMSADDRSQLATAIDRDFRFVPRTMHNDLLPLLFVELAEESVTDVSTAIRIVRRVVKRLQRESVSRATSLEGTPPLVASESVSPETLRNITAEFIGYLMAKGDARDALVFDAYFVRAVSIKNICDELKISRSTCYEIVSKLMKMFEDFIENHEA